MLPGSRDTARPACHARLFRYGRNQALRIPWEFEPAADEIIIYREDDRLVVKPVPRTPTLATVLPRLTRLDEDFSSIADPPVHPEDTL